MGGDLADGFGDVRELGGAVGAEGADLLEGAEGLVDDGALAVDELEVEAHGGERKEQVGEDDSGVDAEALGGGDGDLGGDGGRAADVEEGMVLADGHVLGHVATGLAEEPDGRAVDGLAETGSDEAGGAVGAHFKRLAPRIGFSGLVDVRTRRSRYPQKSAFPTFLSDIRMNVPCGTSLFNTPARRITCADR